LQDGCSVIALHLYSRRKENRGRKAREGGRREKRERRRRSKMERVLPIARKENFLEIPSRFLLKSHWPEHVIWLPSAARETGKCSFNNLHGAYCYP
jgi:hypothetical protein